MKMTDKNIPILDSRLGLAASFVRHDSVVADIGTDHAYLPICLLLNGKVRDAVAADINEGPLDRARINAKRYGLSDRITFCLSDGLKNIPLLEKRVSDIVICGMGGELISSIIEASDFVKNPSVRLILQPMSHADKLRSFLCKNGFEIIDGGMAKAQGKIYQCIVCSYDGKVRSLSPAELELGAENIRNSSLPLFQEALNLLFAKTERAIEGRRHGNLDTSELTDLLCELVLIKKEFLK